MLTSACFGSLINMPQFDKINISRGLIGVRVNARYRNADVELKTGTPGRDNRRIAPNYYCDDVKW
jgi:hypothetical protein